MDLLDEDEQWNAIKRWFRANGPTLLVMILVALVGWFGWKWWQGRADQQALAASALYDRILATFDSDDLASAATQIEALRSAHPDSPYVAAADLAAARVYVAANELDKAASHLERVANNAPDKQLRPIARLRLARVQSAQGQYDKALATLGTADMGVHQSAFHEVRGDVLFAKGDNAAALKEYESAKELLAPESAGPEGVGPMLDLKISDLKAAL